MKCSKLLSVAIALAMLLALSAGPSGAQGPAPQGQVSPQVTVGSTFTYQGQLERDGNPIDATCEMTFTLYDDAAAGNPVSNPINASITVNDGLFTVALDFGSLFNGEARWLEVAVLCPGDASANTLAPRQELTGAPYALGLRPGTIVVGTVNSGAILAASNSATTGSYSHGLYGRSDSSSTGAAGVSGRSGATSGYAYGVRGEAASVIGAGVYGENTATSGNAYGIRGVSNSTTGRGVYGEADTDTGANYGVYGVTLSATGHGVYGWARATTGDSYGVWGQSDSPTGIGVRGFAGATSGITYGVHGEVYSSEGRGVVGYAHVGSGDARGVYGRSDSSDGFGVYGLATAGSGYATGVYGSSYSPTGAGLTGDSGAGTGVYGHTSTGMAVYGYADGSGVALKAEGQTGGNLIEAWHGPLFGDRRFYVADNGNVYADGQYLNPASGYAEMLPGAAGLEAGDVLVVGADGNLVRCDTAYQPTVVGVYAPQAGFIGGAAEDAAGQVPLAVVGVVTVKVSAENGPIAPGDLLVAAATPGHAMRAGDNPALGTVIGKALGSLDKDTGTLLMLVMLR